MKINIGLLSEKQVLSDNKIDVIKAIGSRCEATDYAVINGAAPGSTRWFLSSAAGYGDVCAINEEGKKVVAYAQAQEGIRPVIFRADGHEPVSAADSNEFSFAEEFGPVQSRKDLSGFTEVELGEYPQQAADRETARILESEFLNGTSERLFKTGKCYDAIYDEYAMEQKAADDHKSAGEGALRKFIRANYLSSEPHQLSDGKVYHERDAVWIEVSPLKWLHDSKAGLLLSKKAVAYGTGFCAGNVYDGEFEGTKIYTFLNEEFAKALVPSKVQEMTAGKEKTAETEKLNEKRRNPYDLSFHSVSEEDIIRGAIESDIAVFLHGPSSEGKSARIKQIDPTCEIIYLRNATPDSLNGRSVYNQETGEMIDIPPTWYKKVVAKCEKEPDRNHVVFFDEINNALPSIQGMAFNIVLDREVNGLWKLPENARVVAAGNDMQDSLAANQIAAPFFNRFAHVYINTTTEKWLKWARDNHIHPAIYSYIAFKKGETLRSKYDGEKPNADPRKWEMASKMLYATSQPEMLRSLIGEEITEEFVQFCMQPVITLQRVLEGDYTEEEIKALNTAQRYATTMGLSQAEAKDLEVVRTFLGLLGEEFLSVFDDLWSRHNS